MRCFCKCLRENFASPLTYFAAILFAVLCSFGVKIQIGDDVLSFFEVVFNEKLLSNASKSSDCSSYIMSLKFDNSEWFTIGIAILTTVPALFTYIRTIDKVHNYALIRTNYKTYSAGIVFSSFITGVVITLAGIAVYSSVVYLIFPSIEQFEDPIYMMIYGETAAERLTYLLKKILNYAFVGGLLPVFAITLYRFIRSDFLAATIPMMIMYISVKILPNYREWFSSDAERLQNVFLSFLMLLFPSNLTVFGASLESSLNMPFWIAYIVLGAFLGVLYLLFNKSIKKV